MENPLVRDTVSELDADLGDTGVHHRACAISAVIVFEITLDVDHRLACQIEPRVAGVLDVLTCNHGVLDVLTGDLGRNDIRDCLISIHDLPVGVRRASGHRGYYRSRVIEAIGDRSICPESLERRVGIGVPGCPGSAGNRLVLELNHLCRDVIVGNCSAKGRCETNERRIGRSVPGDCRQSIANINLGPRRVRIRVECRVGGDGGEVVPAIIDITESRPRGVEVTGTVEGRDLLYLRGAGHARSRVVVELDVLELPGIESLGGQTHISPDIRSVTRINYHCLIGGDIEDMDGDRVRRRSLEHVGLDCSQLCREVVVVDVFDSKKSEIPRVEHDLVRGDVVGNADGDGIVVVNPPVADLDQIERIGLRDRLGVQRDVCALLSEDHVGATQLGRRCVECHGIRRTLGDCHAECNRSSAVVDHEGDIRRIGGRIECIVVELTVIIVIPHHITCDIGGDDAEVIINFVSQAGCVDVVCNVNTLIGTRNHRGSTEPVGSEVGIGRLLPVQLEISEVIVGFLNLGVHVNRAGECGHAVDRNCLRAGQVDNRCCRVESDRDSRGVVGVTDVVIELGTQVNHCITGKRAVIPGSPVDSARIGCLDIEHAVAGIGIERVLEVNSGNVCRVVGIGVNRCPDHDRTEGAVHAAHSLPVDRVDNARHRSILIRSTNVELQPGFVFIITSYVDINRMSA